MQMETNISKRIKPHDSDSDANFVGWQETFLGNKLPLFNITVADHPLSQCNRIHGPHDVGWEFDHAIEFNLVWSRRAIKVEGVPVSTANDAGLKTEATSLQSIPQYAEVPPNIEAKRIISCFSAVPPINLTTCY